MQQILDPTPPWAQIPTQNLIFLQQENSNPESDKNEAGTEQKAW